MSANNPKTDRLKESIREYNEKAQKLQSSPGTSTDQGKLQEDVNTRALRDKLFDRIDDAGIILDDVTDVTTEMASGYHPAMAFIRFTIESKFNVNPIDVENAIIEEFPAADDVSVKAAQKDQMDVRLGFYLIRT